ncbi:MAG: DUF4347 domain-containing protein [Burkholderiales bacterium]|nr:DUF4347 domain-containing protein [Burkholderiales bacterium]
MHHAPSLHRPAHCPEGPGLRRELIVADGSAPEIRALLQGAAWPAITPDAGDDALHAITTALAGERLDTLHLVAHGRAGGFTFGGHWVDAEALRARAECLAQWPVARIVLWSCALGADATFVRTLAELTGADVLASPGFLGQRDGITQWPGQADPELPPAASVFAATTLAGWAHHLGVITVSFASGFVGANTGTNSSSPAYSFAEMGWSNVQFQQNAPGNVFVAQGNDIIGTVLITDKNSVEHAITGFIKWRTPSGGSPSTMVFEASVTATLDTDNAGTYTNGTYAINGSSTYIGLTFNGDSLSFTEGGSITGNAATSGLLDTLNVYLAAQPQLTVNDVTVNEAAGTMTFTVTMSTTSADSVTVKYETHDGTAAAGSDYTALATGTLTFAPGDTSKTIVVTISDDMATESAETFTVLLHDPVFAAISDDTGVGTINDNDATAGLTLGAVSGHTTEAGGTATFTVALSSAPAQDVTVSVSSNDATEGSAGPATLTFTSANWNTPQTVTVTGVDDALIDGNIAYQVNLGTSSSDNSYNGLTGNRAVTNDDNDSASLVLGAISGHTTEAGGTATFTVKLGAQPAQDVSVSVSSNDATEGSVGPATLTFTPANWNTPQTVTVTGADDALVDGNVGYQVDLASSSADNAFNGLAGNRAVTNDDNDSASLVLGAISGHTTEAGGTATFTVKLGAQPGQNVSVSVGSNDSTEGTVSAATLSFTPANWNTPQTVTVTGVDDPIIDGNIAYQVDLASSSTDNVFNGLTGSRAVTNDDNDVAALVLGAVSGHTTEAGGTASFTVRLGAQPAQNVTVSLAGTDATEGSLSASTLSFTAANWNTPQTVTVTGVDDFIIDGAIAYQVNLSSSSTDGNFNGLTGSRALTNDDNDVAALVVGAVSGPTSETGLAAQFTVRLAAQPTQNVTVAVASNNLGEGTVGTSSLSFTPANWNVPQTITATGVDDQLDDGDIVYTVALNASSADAHFNGLANTASITNADDDVTGLVLGPVTRHTSEAGASASFTVRLSSQPNSHVTVDVSSSDTTEGTAAPTALSFTPSNWWVQQQVTVTGVDDVLIDGAIPYQVLLRASSGDALYNGRSTTAALVNDDDDIAGLIFGPAGGHTREDGSSTLFTVALANKPSAPVSVSVASGDASEGEVLTTTLSFTPDNWNQPQWVQVKGVDDPDDDGDISFPVQLSTTSADAHYQGLGASRTLVNDDDDGAGLVLGATQLTTSEAGQSASFTLRLASRPSGPVTVTLDNGNPAEIGVGSPTMSFTPDNWNQPQTVTVTGRDDVLDDGDISVALGLTASSSDANYQGRSASVAVLNLDDDSAALVLGAPDRHTSEDGQSAGISVRLASQPAAPVTVSVASQDTSEGLPQATSLVFTPQNWNLPQTLSVVGQDDALIDGAVSYGVKLAASSADPAYQGRSATASLVNDDNDSAGLLFDALQLRTGEDGRSASVGVRLASAPAAPVTLAVQVGNPAEGRLALAILSFTADNWQQAQTVAVTGVDDDRIDGDITHALSFSASSADPQYQGRQGSVAVVNADDDRAALVLQTQGLRTTESGGSAGFQLRLASRPQAPVTVTVGSDAPAEGAPAPLTLQFTPDNWQQLQTVTVAGIDDPLFDGDQAYAVTLSASSADAHYQGLRSSVALVNEDNDKLAEKLPPSFGFPIDEQVQAGDTARVLDPQGRVVADHVVTLQDILSGEVVKLPAALDDGVYTFVNQILGPTGELKSEVPITITVVTDRDGVAPATERAAQGGDGNHDGQADWQQNNVTQLPLASVAAFAAGAAAAPASFGVVMVGSAVATGTGPVQLDPGAQLQDLLVSAPGAAWPGSLTASTPRWSFAAGGQAGAALADADPGTEGLQTQLVFELPAGTQANAVFLYDAKSGRWVEMPVAAKLVANGARLVDTNQDGTPDRLLLSLTDGGPLDSDGLANGRISSALLLGQRSAEPVYSVLLASGDRYLSTSAAEAARLAAGPDARFEGVAFDSLPEAAGGRLVQAWQQPFTVDWHYGRSAEDMPYACYELVPGAAGFSAAPASQAVGEAFHAYLQPDTGRTQLGTPAMAAGWGLAAQGYRDLGLQFNTTRDTAFSFDPEGYLVANRGQAAVQALVGTLAARFATVSDPGFVEAVEQHYLTQAVLVGLPQGDAAGAADLNAAFGTHFGG